MRTDSTGHTVGSTLPVPPQIPSRGITLYRSQQSPFAQIKMEKIINDLRWENDQLRSTLDNWYSIASTCSIDTSKQLHNLDRVERELPEEGQSFSSQEVRLRYWIVMRTIYCGQIIRKVAKAHIIKTAKEACKMEELKHLHGLIMGSEQWLLKRLPPKMEPSMSISCIEAQYDWLMGKLSEIQEKILKQATKLP